MAKYDLPKLTKPAKIAKKQVLLAASGDLRLSANQTCWPKQKEMEDLLAKARGRGRLRAGPRPSVQGGREARLHRLAKRGHVRFCRHRSRRQADRGRSRLAVFAPRPGRTALAQGPDPDRGQLVGHVAGPGRHAQPERLADQGRQEVLHPLERGFHRRVLRRRPAPLAPQGRGPASDQTRHAAPESQNPLGRTQPGRGPGPAARPRKGHHGHFRRGLHGHVQRHHPGRAAQPAGRVQGAAQPVGPLLRNHAGRRRRGLGRPPLDGGARHEVRDRARRAKRSDRPPDPRPVQDVHRRACGSPTISAATRSASSISRD